MTFRCIEGETNLQKPGTRAGTAVLTVGVEWIATSTKVRPRLNFGFNGSTVQLFSSVASAACCCRLLSKI